VKEVVGKVFLDQITLISAANHEIPHAMRGEDLHDVPQNGSATDFDQRLRAKMCLLANARSQTSSQYHCFHTSSLRLIDSLRRASRRATPSWMLIPGVHPGTPIPRQGFTRRAGFRLRP